MKLKNNILILLAVIAVIAAGCAKEIQFGQEISGREIAKIGDILSSPEKYEGKIVKVQGKIIRECPTGCWFNLKDETGVIYVDIMPSGFAIPQKTGKQATVEGKVTLKDRRLMIIGKGVEIK
jgi:uncharacterized protein YdeI (BOF family)